MRPEEFDLHFSVVLVPTATPTASRVLIARGDIRPWRLAEDLKDVQIDPPEFDRVFTVRAASPPFARQLLQAPLVEVLLHADQRWAFEVVGGTLLVSSMRLPPEELPLLFDAARDFVRHIPESLRQ